MKKTSRIGKSGFTLVELIVVVAIIALLAGVATPAYMKVRYSKSRIAAKIERSYAQNGETARLHGVAPVIDKFAMDWILESDYQRVGLEVYSRYRLNADGEIEFRSADLNSETALHIPFPKGTIEASNVSLVFMEDGKDPYEPDNLQFRQTGIFWSGVLPKNDVVRAKIAYSALGTETVDLDLPEAQRISNVDLSLDLQGTPADAISSFSLTPTGVSDGLREWNYQNLVTDRKISVSIPGTESPSGRLILLFRFMALALLLFGGGFLYMSESRRPNSLAGFRLGHFFLLALTYSLFFVIFSVIIYRELFEVPVAVLIAAVGSFPLLVMHVARIVSLGFAIKHILPLAALTIAVVVNGVYGGILRDLFFLGMLVLISAYLTITYRPAKVAVSLPQTQEG
ncbi:MAG: prepilin-type N-terminal cleavage/methylation domain-containing protein [Verrucomicrobiales bacterium]|nr:prepilin-type N-terminal cleavage/methylation domain-containing protein [Verrucomicrobiales bacterium]